MSTYDPPKVPLPVRGSRLRRKTWFLVPPGVHVRNGISIGSAVLAQLMLVANRQTDRQTTLQR